VTENYTTGELARNLASMQETIRELERRLTLRQAELHADNRGAISEVNDSVQRLSTVVQQLAGQVTALEFAQRAEERTVGEIVSQMTQLQRDATRAATAGATQAIHDTAPDRKQLSRVTAMWTGITSGAVIGGAYVLKLVFEVITQHLKP
jgi:chromosome segregation ATPase